MRDHVEVQPPRFSSVPWPEPRTDTGTPSTTVVIPTHNRRRLLERTLLSVLRQEGVDLDVVVVDDGGTDGTWQALNHHGLANVRVIRHEHSRGVSAARNAGLAAARSPHVAFVDDDDIWAPRKLAAQLAALRKGGGTRWCCVGAVHVDAELTPLCYRPTPVPGDLCTALRSRNAIPGGGSGVLVETDLAREVGGFDESMSILADWEFYLRLSRRSPVVAVDEPLLGYYVHADSMYHDPLGLLHELLYMERKHGDLDGAGRFELDHGFWYMRLAGMANRLGDRRSMVRLLAQGLVRRGPAPLLGAVRRKIQRSGPPLDRSVAEIDQAELTWLTAYQGL
ncbi:glycosyltransferase [Modestobacter sp. URMC 112]